MMEPGSTESGAALSALVVPLLKGVIYQENDARQWQALLRLQPAVRDYVAVLGLELALDEAEGYAFLRSRPQDDEDSELQLLPRLVPRRPLVELVRVFMPDSSNDARLVDQVDAHINRIIELGFLRRLKSGAVGNAAASYEVRRILKAFVDAQWLSEFNERLAQYHAQLGAGPGDGNDG